MFHFSLGTSVNPPTIVCPTTVQNEQIGVGQTSTAVSANAVTAFSAAGSIPVTYIPSNVNIGQTNVLATATDPVTGLTATCVFVVDATVGKLFFCPC